MALGDTSLPVPEVDGIQARYVCLSLKFPIPIISSIV